MIQQLRIYEIFEKNKAAFHARFRDHAARIMTGRYGFKFASMWETKIGDRTEFVYLLEWPDEATKIAQWARRGEHEVSRNPSRRESRVVSGFTCGPTPRAYLFLLGAHGCDRHPAFPAPFVQEWAE